MDDYNENKQQQQQQQQRPVTGAGPAAAPTTSSVDVAAITTAISTAMLEHNKSLERIENKLDDMASVTMRMSEATLDFSSSLLSDLKIKYVVQAVNEEAGEGQMEKYPWGEDECEADGQPGCQTILLEEMLPLSVDGKAFGFYDVRSCPLPQLKAGKRKSNDILIWHWDWKNL